MVYTLLNAYMKINVLTLEAGNVWGKGRGVVCICSLWGWCVHYQIEDTCKEKCVPGRGETVCISEDEGTYRSGRVWCMVIMCNTVKKVEGMSSLRSGTVRKVCTLLSVYLKTKIHFLEGREGGTDGLY